MALRVSLATGSLAAWWPAQSLGDPVGQDQREEAQDGQGEEVAPHDHNMEGGSAPAASAPVRWAAGPRWRRNPQPSNILPPSSRLDAREAALSLMDRFARALVRWRWVVLGVWAVIGAVAAVRAPATPSLLNIRGGSERETEASRTEDLLTRRFSRPIGEFFAVTFEAPASFDEPAPRAALDTLLAALGREPYIRGLVSYPSTGDTTFLSRDQRATFVIVALEATRGDSAGALVLPVRRAGAGDAGARSRRRRATGRR